MISIENFVFDTVYSQLSVLHPEADISSGYEEKEASHLSVVIRETGNVPYQASNTDDCAENHARVTFEVEVVSDKTGESRSKIATVLNDADVIMQSMKFRRTFKSNAMNIGRTKFRQYARYEVIVGKPVEINGKTVYQMYRR